MTPVWPDLVIAAIVLIAALKGFKRGFISELAGAIALFTSVITPFYYNGFADGPLEQYVHLGPGSAHVIGMFLTGLATYGAIMVFAWFLNRFAKLPFLGIGNKVAGAAVGVVKSSIFLAVALWIALFFPLSPDIRSDFHRSRLVALLTAPDEKVDGAINAVLPWFARPFVRPWFDRHRV
ncbi:MAG: hypothetical protein NVS9B12_06720 [Vulcanimicrobiaceae bacterium]